MTSSSITPIPFFIFLSKYDAGQGFKISYILKIIKDAKSNNKFSNTVSMAINCQTTSSMTITLESFSPFLF